MGILMLNMNLPNTVLNVAKIVEQSKVNGPGLRFTIWVQGCSLRCEGCINKELWPKKTNQLIKLSDLLDRILNTPNIEGVTYTGGEPFEQAEALYYLSTLLKEKGYSIVSYSGFTYEEILNSDDKFKKLLLSTLDILIDGRYEKDKSAPLLWRGSTNQRVLFLSPLYKHYEPMINDLKLQMEFSIDPKGEEVSIIGNFSYEILEEIRKRMKSYGIKI